MPEVFFIGFLGQARFWRGFPAKAGILLKILFQQGPVAQVFKPAAAKRHGRFKDFIADGQEHVPGGHAAEHGALLPVGGLDGLAEVQGGRAIDTNAALF